MSIIVRQNMLRHRSRRRGPENKVKEMLRKLLRKLMWSKRRFRKNKKSQRRSKKRRVMKIWMKNLRSFLRKLGLLSMFLFRGQWSSGFRKCWKLKRKNSMRMLSS